MNRWEELERLIQLYQKRYAYSRLNAIKSIRSDCLDLQRREQKQENLKKEGKK